LVNDSNLDWNQALPEVENFVRQRGLKQVLLDEYGVVEPAGYVPQALVWDCQQPAPQDRGQWAVVSANYMLDSGTCIWLLQYEHQALAGGSMYAVRLPKVIPAAGQPGGPPLPADFRFVGGMPASTGGLSLFTICIRDPQQLQPTMDRMMAMAEEYRKNNNKKKK
jgi:hypothetical protein